MFAEANDVLFFCITHIEKNIRNALFRNRNHLISPKLVLSTDYVLEAGVCSVKWIRDLCLKNKEKLMSNFRMNRNVACVGNLCKKKASPELALFDTKLTTALKDEHSKVAKGTWAF